MQTHPFFTDILLHSDEELADLLGVSIIERETIHEWPLSCVQRLLMADGARRVYKSQLPPTVEAEFYARASSPLLPGHRALGTLGECSTLLFDWIEAPLLRDEARNESAWVERGREVVAQIGEIEGDLPVYRDIGSADAWMSVGEAALGKLRTLVQDGRFGSPDLEGVDRVEKWAASARILETVTACPRVIHGDLTAEQVFVTPDGYRVIDWQRPVVGPPEVDLAALLIHQKRDPRQFLDAGVVGVFWFLRLCWAVEAQHDLFPRFQGPLFDQWAIEAITEILRDGD